jgi:hypothetical protein
MTKQFTKQRVPTRNVKHYRFAYTLPLHAGVRPKASDIKLHRVMIPGITRTEAKHIFKEAFPSAKIVSIEC